MTNQDWRINIEDLAERVSEKYGAEVVQFAFQRVGASSFDDLNPSEYESLFGDLMQMDCD